MSPDFLKVFFKVRHKCVQLYFFSLIEFFIFKRIFTPINYYHNFWGKKLGETQKKKEKKVGHICVCKYSLTLLCNQVRSSMN